MPSATGICSLVSAVVLIIVGHEAAPQGGVCTNITVGELLQGERELLPSDFAFV